MLSNYTHYDFGAPNVLRVFVDGQR